MNLTVYNTATGEIEMLWSGGPTLQDGQDYITEHYDPGEYYILDGVPTARPTQSTTLTGTTLSGMPIPCALHAGGEVFEITDGEAELTVLLPGTYPLLVRAWPYKDWTGEVTV